LTDEMIVAATRGDEKRLRLVRSLGLVSYMCMPLVAHGRTLGALTFATAESRRRYSEQDLAFAQDLAHRAALAVDNAIAYNQLQAADRLKDEFLATLSRDVRAIPAGRQRAWPPARRARARTCDRPPSRRVARRLG
jgi:GAF domain-containing protein